MPTNINKLNVTKRKKLCHSRVTYTYYDIHGLTFYYYNVDVYLNEYINVIN